MAERHHHDGHPAVSDVMLPHALEGLSAQAGRARRAETARARQRSALLLLMAQTMAELQISMSELLAVRRSLREREPGDASRDESDDVH
jgi:hypothetical protein